ncbi:T9SS type A sorting domain-containing protein [uncultured Marixanthomonas sp.]|uniref:T9SS type A sorting domain-containing protein n=1 Tax=uncultured Marixanthomonas sp. TaxID=757245 RepID=UPI0030D8BA9E|tara:strand:+ start:247 stop:1965 length:1719 start_codon:yes stop_codon:yes gene_type:complete
MKKITLLLVFFIGSVGLINAQSSLTGTNTGDQNPVTVESLLTKLQNIGTVNGSLNDYFTKQEQRMLNVHFNGVENIAPVVITQSDSQTITAGEEIACASATSFRDNNLFRAFDLAGDFGITDGLEVNAVEFAIGTISTPTSFPITANIYSADPGAFPGGTLTLEGTAVYDATNADAATIVNLPLSATIPAGQAMVMELVLVDDGTDTHNMRFGCNSEGETGPSYIQAPDCGAATPSPFSDLGLTQGLVWNVLGDDEPGGGGGDDLIYGISNGSQELLSFETGDPGTTQVVGTSPITVNFENAGAIDPANPTTGYVVDNGGEFYSFDVGTGTYTSLGNIPGDWVAMEFDNDGTLYGIAGPDLYVIDPSGPSATVVGSLGLATGDLAIGLAIDGDGQGYLYELLNDLLYSVDLSTGTATSIGPIGFDANFGQGMCYDEVTDTVYMSAFNSATFEGEWRSVDLATGNTTFIGNINSASASTQVAWSSVNRTILSVSNNVLEDFSYYPTPADDVITLKAKSNIGNVVIYSSLGQKVIDQNIGSASTELNISALSTGTYIMKVSVNGEIGTYKVIKR